MKRIYLLVVFFVLSGLYNCDSSKPDYSVSDIYFDEKTINDILVIDSLEMDDSLELSDIVYDFNGDHQGDLIRRDEGNDIESQWDAVDIQDISEIKDIYVEDASEIGDTQIISKRRGFPVGFPWVSFYGSADGVDIDRVAQYFRIINIDADPDLENFTDAQIERLKNNGKNKVISYLNIGSCEEWRSYYKNNPPGFKSCVNSGALTTVYSNEYPDERWADLSNKDYQDLIVNYVARRLADRGVDGFFLDNLEVVEHGESARYGPCDSKCAQGGLDIVYKLREKFPDMLIVMQNATSDFTLNGYTNGIWFPLLLDGVSHEEVYSNVGDSEALSQMKKWKSKNILINGFPFWLAVEEYVGECSDSYKKEAEMIYKRARDDGFNAYVTDASSGQQSPCFWE